MRNILPNMVTGISNGLYVSRKAAISMEIISNFQLLHLILATTSLTKDTFGDKNYLLGSVKRMASISGALNIFEYVKQLSLVNAALAIFSTYFAVHFLFFALGAYQTVIKGNMTVFLSKVHSTLCLLHSRVLFFLIQYCFFYLIKQYTAVCSLDEGEDDYCSNTWFAIATLFSCLSLLFALINEFLLYRVNKNKNAYASKTNLFHQVVLFHKITSLCLYFFLEDELLLDHISSPIHFLFLACTFCILYKKIPFYDTKVLKVILVMTGINFSLSLVSVIKSFTKSTDVSGISLSMACPLILKLYLSIFNKLFERISRGKIGSPEHAIHFAIFLKENNLGHLSFPVFMKSFPSISIRSCGYVSKEIFGSLQSKEVQTTAQYEQEVYKHIAKKLTLVLNSHPNSNILILYLANIYLKKVRNILKAATLLQMVGEQKPSLTTRSSIENMNMMLKELCRREYGNDNIELDSFFSFRETLDSMRSHVRNETMNHIKVWQEIISKKLSVIKVINLAAEIDKLSCKIYTTYNNSLPVKFPNFLLIYSIYLQTVRGLPHEAAQVLKNLQTMILAQTSHSHMLNAFSEDAALLILSLKKGKAGEIIDGSTSIQNLFNVPKSKLIGKSLNAVLPKMIAENYGKLIDKYVKGYISKLDYKFRTFGKTHDGQFFEVEVQFQLYPHSTYGLSLLVLFRRISRASSVMVIDPNNIILECSKDLQQILNLDNTNLSSRKVQDILPEYDSINTAVNFIFRNPENTNNSNQGSTNLFYNKKSSFSVHTKLPVETSSQYEDPLAVSLTQIRNMEDAPLLTTVREIPTQKLPRFSSVVTSLANDHHTIRELSSFRQRYGNNFGDDTLAEIFHKLVQGVRLRLYPLQAIGSTRESTVDFNVQIKLCIVEGKTYKIMILSLLESNETVSEEEYSGSFSPARNQELDDTFADNFPVDEEKNRMNKFQCREMANPISFRIPLIKTRNLSSILSKNVSNKVRNILNNKKDEQEKINILNKIDQAEERNSDGADQIKLIKAAKTLKQVFSRNQPHPFSKLAILVIYLAMLLVIMIAGLNYFWSVRSIYQIHQGLKIVSGANERLILSVDVWYNLLIMYSRATGPKPNLFVALFFQKIVRSYTQSLIQKNNDLRNLIESYNEEVFLAEAFVKDVQLWETSGNVVLNYIEVNTFAATNLLTNNYLLFGNHSNITQLVKDDTFLFTLNNTANDYLLSSKKFMYTTQDFLQRIIDQNFDMLEILLGLTNGSLLILFSLLIFLVWMIVQSYKKLFQALLKVPSPNVSLRIHQLQIVQNILDTDIRTRDFTINGINLLNKSNDHPSHFSKQSNENYANEKVLTKDVMTHLMKYLGIAVLAIVCISCIFLNSLLRSESKFTSLRNFKSQLSLSTDAIYQTTSLFSIFYTLILFPNSTSLKIRNQSPTDQITQSLNENSKLTQSFIENFSKEINDPIIESLLKNNVCDYILTNQAGACEKSTKGKTIGLLSVIANYVEISKNYYDQYTKNNTESALRTLLDSYASTMSIEMATLYSSFEFLISHIQYELDKKVQHFVREELIQLLTVLGVIFTAIAFLYIITIKRFLFLDIGKRKILKIVPYRFIGESRIFKFYLIQEFQKEVPGIRDII